MLYITTLNWMDNHKIWRRGKDRRNYILLFQVFHGKIQQLFFSDCKIQKIYINALILGCKNQFKSSNEKIRGIEIYIIRKESWRNGFNFDCQLLVTDIKRIVRYPLNFSSLKGEKTNGPFYYTKAIVLNRNSNSHTKLKSFLFWW